MVGRLATFVFWGFFTYLAVLLQISLPQISITWWVILLVAFEERFGWILVLAFWSFLAWLLAALSSLSWLWWWLPVAVVIFIKPWVTRRFLLNQNLQRAFGLLALSLSHSFAFELWAFLQGGREVTLGKGLLEVLLTFFLGMVLLILGPELKAWWRRQRPQSKQPIQELNWMSSKERALKNSPRTRKPFGLD